jgi:hypothetical protein
VELSVLRRQWWLGVVWLAACSDIASSTLQDPPSLTLTSAFDTLDAVGDTKQLFVSATGPSGDRVTWQSSDATTVEVSSSGRITARKGGDANVTARAGYLSATARITVRPPAAVVVSTASRTQLDASTYRVTAALRNTGGRGVYRIEFYSRAAGVVNPPATLTASTEPVSGTATYGESLSWAVAVPPNNTVEWFIVLTREPNTATYRETARFNV